jgi:hypothetical protein
MNPPVQTVKILYDVARRIGLDPDTNLSPDQAEEILGFMDDRLREGWEMYDFLDITLTEERAFRNAYDPSVCYNAGDYVWDWDTRSYYQAVTSGVGGPLSNPKLWTPFSKVSPAYVEWQQIGQNPIGTAFKAYTVNPYEDVTAIDIGFTVSRRGLELISKDCPATVWLQFRLPYPGLGQFNWSSTQTYALGDPTLYNGDTYHSLVDGNLNQSPDAFPAVWALFRVPYPLAKFITQAAYSDTLITNGQNEKAATEEGKAYSRLSQAFDVQRLQQAQVDRFTVLQTHSC